MAVAHNPLVANHRDVQAALRCLHRNRVQGFQCHCIVSGKEYEAYSFQLMGETVIGFLTADNEGRYCIDETIPQDVYNEMISALAETI